MTARRAVFLDRDGTIIDDVGYPRDIAEIRFVENCLEALAALHRCGFALVIVSNQSGVGRGLITVDEMAAFHAAVAEQMALAGAPIVAAEYCPHSPDEGCVCRKPQPELLHRAAGALGIALTESWMIGDKESDVQAGAAAGCHTIRFAATPAAVAAGTVADALATDWREIASIVAPECAEPAT